MASDTRVPGAWRTGRLASDLIKAMFGKTGKARARATGEVTGEVRRLLNALGKKSLGRTELQLALGLKGRANFRDRYMLPALNVGFIHAKGEGRQPVNIAHTARTGKTYYLHEKASQAGKRIYFFSMDADGQLAAAMPNGYEIYENIGGQVFLRKRTAPIIRPGEMAIVETALRQHGEPWQYRAEAKKSAIVVYDAGDMAGLDSVARLWGRSPLPDDMKQRHATYMAVLRFTLADKKTRAFVTDRFCFRGSIDDWIPIGGPGTLASQVRQFVEHLGRESFYELI